MVKNVVSKVMWMGRATVFLVGFAVILAVTVGLGTTALAAAPGDPFKLGKYNTVGKITKLIGSAPRAMLRIDNNGRGAALELNVEDGNAPMRVNSDEKIANLNADTVDGMSSDDLRGQQGDKGDQGDPGESVTSEPLQSGDANCLNGGSQFEVQQNTTFACNGADGEDGEDGVNGERGLTGPAGPGVAAWARVNENGTIEDSFGVTGVTRTGTGSYFVDIGRSSGDCASVATPTGVNHFVGASPSNSGSGQSIGVAIVNNSNALVDEQFSIAVFC